MIKKEIKQFHILQEKVYIPFIVRAPHVIYTSICSIENVNYEENPLKQPLREGNSST